MSLFEKKMNVTRNTTREELQKENERLAGKSNLVTAWALLATGGAIALSVLLGVKDNQNVEHKTRLEEREIAKQEAEANRCYDPCEPWEMQKQIGQLEGKIAKLEAEKLALQQEKSALAKQVSGKNSNISQLNKQITDLKRQISAKDAEIAKLKQQVGNSVVINIDAEQNAARVRDTIYIEHKKTIYRDYGAAYWSKSY